MKDIIKSNFVRFDSEGLELVVDISTGKAYASESAIPRMLETPRSTIQDALKGCRNLSVENAQVQTSGGLQGCRLYPAFAVYKIAQKYHPALADAMGEAGANVYMLGLAGYQVKVQEPKLKTALELAKEQVKLHEQLELQAMQIKLLEEDNERQSEAIDELFNYSSIIRVSKFNKCNEKAFKWHALKSASLQLGLEIKQVPCPRFTTKNLYSHEAWRLAYSGVLLPETTTLMIKAD